MINKQLILRSYGVIHNFNPNYSSELNQIYFVLVQISFSRPSFQPHCWRLITFHRVWLNFAELPAELQLASPPDDAGPGRKGAGFHYGSVPSLLGILNCLSQAPISCLNCPNLALQSCRVRGRLDHAPSAKCALRECAHSFWMWTVKSPSLQHSCRAFTSILSLPPSFLCLLSCFRCVSLCAESTYFPCHR